MYVDVEQKNWDEILPFVTFAYNTAKQETTDFTPFYLLHGREAETTLDTMLPFCPNDFDDNNITKIAARAEESRQLARVHTLRAQDKDRRRYDSKHQMVSYAPGDLVWVYTPVRSLRKTLKKLEVSEEFGIAQNVISRLWQRFQDDGNVSRCYSTSRPRVTTPNEDRYIYLAVTAKRNRRSTASDLSRQLSSATGTTVSRQTVYRR
ncbi:retrovirus-related Pol polyprotein from transposon 412 [Trichonephila clavipes]|uniref:Retrovirus-related Pol polyprotein from transposon 412 n=1 Tax=Trichonephila clavipes TaxID=2585209 RepID=A0A8X6SKD9_TRICX|nr:retrovirus-related Pol polyprotein from transposon 412 [Trichonephila clavipes]